MNPLSRMTESAISLTRAEVQRSELFGRLSRRLTPLSLIS